MGASKSKFWVGIVKVINSTEPAICGCIVNTLALTGFLRCFNGCQRIYCIDTGSLRDVILQVYVGFE